MTPTVDSVLYQLRSWKTDAYRCTPSHDVWRADCPQCDISCALLLVELVADRAVSVSCANGCSSSLVLKRLAALERLDDARRALVHAEAELAA